jgi:broad specificity phosphatase PhoE
MTGATLREKEPFTALFFCRHGETDYPENRFYPSGSGSGGAEPALNENGRLQAKHLERYFEALGKLDALYVSPALRTRQTMDPIAQGRDIAVVVIPELGERGMGLWDGCTAEEIQQKDPEGWRRWKTEPLSFAPPGGESLTDFSQRVAKAVGMILEKEGGRRVIVVTHVGPIRVATAQALGIPLENSKRLVVAPGSVTRIHYTKSWPNLVLFGHQP